MVHYRLATHSDLPQVSGLLCEIMQSHNVEPPGEPALSECLTKILASQDHLFLVAERDDRLVGLCALLFSMSTWSAAPTCEIQDLIVTDSQRRQGLGRGLVDAASELAKARGCVRLFMLAEYWNLDAHAFYRRLGLAEETHLDFERDLRLPLA